MHNLLLSSTVRLQAASRGFLVRVSERRRSELEAEKAMQIQAAFRERTESRRPPPARRGRPTRLERQTTMREGRPTPR